MKVAILADGMYLQHACNMFGIGHIDPTKLPDILLRDDETHHRTYWFDALPYLPKVGATLEQRKRRNDKHAYFDALRYKERIVIEEGEVIPKQATCHYCNREFYVPVQKMVDVKMSVRLVSLAWSETVEKIVLLTGDADLVPAVKDVEQSKTTVRLAYLSEGTTQTSKTLIRECPEKHQLTKEDLEKCIWHEPTDKPESNQKTT